MSGHTYTHHTHTQDNYSNSRCECAPRVNNNYYCVCYTTNWCILIVQGKEVLCASLSGTRWVEENN